MKRDDHPANDTNSYTPTQLRSLARAMLRELRATPIELDIVKRLANIEALLGQVLEQKKRRDTTKIKRAVTTHQRVKARAEAASEQPTERHLEIARQLLRRVE